MKIRLERGGTVFEYERKPMPPERFKAVCAIAGAAVYAGMVIGVAALCGGWGVVAVMGLTAVLAMIAGGAFI